MAIWLPLHGYLAPSPCSEVLIMLATREQESWRLEGSTCSCYTSTLVGSCLAFLLFMK